MPTWPTVYDKLYYLWDRRHSNTSRLCKGKEKLHWFMWRQASNCFFDTSTKVTLLCCLNTYGVWRTIAHHIQSSGKWIVVVSVPYVNGSKRNNLCIAEWLHIFFRSKHSTTLLYYRSEILDKCKHVDKYLVLKCRTPTPLDWTAVFQNLNSLLPYSTLHCLIIISMIKGDITPIFFFWFHSPFVFSFG